FQSWLRVSIDIDHFSKPSSVVQTRHGDIILDEACSSKLYLRGILLPQSSFKEGGYKYGYKFCYGIPTTSGRRLASTLHESQIICSIWEAAMSQAPEDMVSRYVDMLRTRPWSLDIALMDDCLTDSTIKRIWKCLALNAGNEEFYYRGSTEEAIEIRESLRKKPIELPESLWIVLRRQHLILTAREEINTRA
ncbi:hypothetical protein BO78DRAFT_298434, partial [Aspergillus sclerotiicarbonarius CBS 121057]